MSAPPQPASKAAAELVARAYQKALKPKDRPFAIATARGGNVVGGGDWSPHRLVPDIVRALYGQTPLVLRYPGATRPWQHVLDLCYGYLLLGHRLGSDPKVGDIEGGWNFGPEPKDNCTVASILGRMRAFWPELTWEMAQQPQPHEAQLLNLDTSKARKELGWQPVWSLNATLRATAEWYRHYLDHGVAESRSQLRQYIADAHAAGVTGDTVGDPFKDTAGPAINPMIKVANIVAILIIPIIT